MKEMTIDFDDERTLSIEKNNNSVIISLSKEMIPHVKFVFEDSGIPGVVGPHLYMNADEIVTRYLKNITNKNNKTNSQKKKIDKRNFELNVSENFLYNNKKM